MPTIDFEIITELSTTFETIILLNRKNNPAVIKIDA